MKYWSGNDFEYRGHIVKNNKKDGYLNVYDKRNNFIFRVESFGRGCVQHVKSHIDNLIRRYGE